MDATKSILVELDDEAIRKYLSRLLKLAGYCTNTA